LNPQRTIKHPVELRGRGLFSGEPCRIRFLPADADSGVTFVRKDLPAPVTIPLEVDKVAKRARRTSLMNGAVGVETIEHVLAAINGLEIDNITIEMSADETPSLDASAKPFTDAILSAGIVELEAEKRPYVIDEPVSVSHGEATLAALPGPRDCLDIIFDLDYSELPSIGRQMLAFRLGKDDFASQIAPARTFCTEAEAQALRRRGQAQHLTAKDVLVMGPDGPVENTLRYEDEHVRHKICDLIGDLALLGRPLRGRIVGYKSGHELNHELVRKLRQRMIAREQPEELPGEPVMDIRRIMRLLPHRYPFLMIDRIVKIEGDREAIGIKNVSINEPFFQGHFPGQPIMPAVMILEAMAQLSGILVGRRLEHIGKVGMLMSLDRVKLRRAVQPGDQLILKAEALRVRSRTGHCRCQAYVGNELAAEAELKFMLVDAEPV